MGTKVLQVSATDRDAEEYNSHVTYSLRTSPAALFVTDARDGWISTGASLRGARAVIHLQVTAADSGYPVMSNAVGVTIIVRDIGGQCVLYLENRSSSGPPELGLASG